MVQVHVGGDHPVDRIAGQPQGIQRGQQARHGEVGAGVDEGGAAVFDDQVGRIEQRSVKAGVDGVDAISQVLDKRQGHVDVGQGGPRAENRAARWSRP